MTAWEAALWGAGGSLALEVIEFCTAVRACRGWPWQKEDEPDFGPYVVSVFLRVLLGTGLASAMGKSGDICTPIACFMTGMAAPVIVAEKLGSAAKKVLTPSAGEGQETIERERASS